MASVADLVADVRTVGFDATDTVILGWLNRRHLSMCARSKVYRRTDSSTLTVAGQQNYPLPVDLVEVYSLSVGGQPYGRGLYEDLLAGAAGFLVVNGPGGIVVDSADDAGGPELALFPTPTVDGTPIVIYGQFTPGPLSLDPLAPGGLLIPDDLLDGLVAGAVATGYTRVDSRQDLAEGLEAQFDNACEELRRRVRRQYGPRGPRQIRVGGAIR